MHIQRWSWHHILGLRWLQRLWMARPLLLCRGCIDKNRLPPRLWIDSYTVAVGHWCIASCISYHMLLHCPICQYAIADRSEMSIWRELILVVTIAFRCFINKANEIRWRRVKLIEGWKIFSCSICPNPSCQHWSFSKTNTEGT